ncbi:MAG TPA: SRPBCC family protein [Solirubrobacterales bacterium]|nr:SRPBCC family protein [Solirubrobacterales bacterium]
MAEYTTTVPTDWSPEQAFDYLAEFSNAADWDPSIEAGRSLSAEPLTVGARFEIELSMLGRTTMMTYETVEIDRPHRVVLRSETAVLISVDTLSFDPAPGGGTAVTYDADLTLKGPLKLLDPALALGFNRVADKARDGLRERLAGSPPARAEDPEGARG